MKKVTGLLLMILMIALTACGKNDGGQAGTDESLNYILDRKQFIVGLDDSFPPMGFRDEDNNIVGFDIDLA